MTTAAELVVSTVGGWLWVYARFGQISAPGGPILPVQEAAGP